MKRFFCEESFPLRPPMTGALFEEDFHGRDNEGLAPFPPFYLISILGIF
jgi:hypothetical protein